RRQDHQGSETGGPSAGTADHVRVGRESRDSQGTGTQRAFAAWCASRRVDGIGANMFRALLLVVVVALVGARQAHAQATLGEMLDVGAKPLSPDEFRQEIMQRIVIGPTSTGGTLEVVYSRNQMIEGRGTLKLNTAMPTVQVSGEWSTDSVGRICTSLRIGNVQ